MRDLHSPRRAFAVARVFVVSFGFVGSLGLSAAMAAPPPAGAAPGVPDCPILEPGKALGRFSVGTVLRAPEAVKPDAVDGWFRPTDPAGAETRLRFDDAKRLVGFDTPLPACVVLTGKQPVTLKAPSAHQLAAALGTCGPMQVLEGGNRIECEGLVLNMGSAGGAARVQIGVGATTRPALPCTAYVDADGIVDASGHHPVAGAPVRLEVGARALCLAGRATAVSAATRPADVEGPGCTTEALRGGTHVRCGDTTFDFAGPANALQAISIRR